MMVQGHKQDLSSSTTLTSSSSSEPDDTSAVHRCSVLTEEPSLMDMPITPPPGPFIKGKQVQEEQHHTFSLFPQRYRDFPEHSYSPAPSIADSTSSLADRAANYLAYIHSLAQGFQGELEDVNAFLEQQPSYDESSEVDVQVIEFDCRSPFSPAASSSVGSTSASTRVVGIEDAYTLRRYLDEEDLNVPTTTEGHNDIVKAYLVQGITPQTIALLGAKFNIDQRFWDGHLRETDGTEDNGESRVAVMLQSPREGFSDDVEGALHVPLARTRYSDESFLDISDALSLPSPTTAVDRNSEIGTIDIVQQTQQQTQVGNKKGKKNYLVTNDRCSVYLPTNSQSLIIVFSAAPYRASLLHRILVSPIFCPALSPSTLLVRSSVTPTRAILRLLDSLTAMITQSWSQELVTSTRRVKDMCRIQKRGSWFSLGKKKVDLGASVTKERRRAVNAVKGVRDLLLVVEGIAEEGLKSTHHSSRDEVESEVSILKRDLAAIKRRVRGFEEGVWGWDIGVDEQVWAVLGEGDRNNGILAGMIAIVVVVVVGVVLVVQLTVGG